MNIKTLRRTVISIGIGIAAIAAVGVLAVFSTRDAAPESVTRWLNADEQAEFLALDQKQTDLGLERGTLDTMKRQRAELLEKQGLSDSEQKQIEYLSEEISDYERRLENEPTWEELENQKRSLGTKEPIDGESRTEYTFKTEKNSETS